MTAHRACSGEFFMACLAGEMLSFLMLMENDFIVADFVTIVTEWLKIALIFFFSSHYRNIIKIFKN